MAGCEATIVMPLDAPGPKRRATEGYGGIKSSTGKITPPVMFKGVALKDLALMAGMDEQLKKRLGIVAPEDAPEPGEPDAGLAANLGPRVYRDMWGVVRENPEGSYYFDLKTCPLAGEITAAASIPTIGIGAGPSCDGQVLVVYDMLGLTEEFQPRFVRRYEELAGTLRKAFTRYIGDVRSGKFPSKGESY